MKQLQTPVALTLWNRTDTVLAVLDSLRKVRPNHLYVISDGGRHSEEMQRISSVRKLIDVIDWPCEVTKEYHQDNVGPKIALARGLNNFFEKYEQGIVLEHDCLPEPSFYGWCEELLKYYRDDDRVMHISGNNFQNGIRRGDGSYYFSRVPSIWGWATWKRAWKHYDAEMSTFPKYEADRTIRQVFVNKMTQRFWLNTFRQTYTNKINTWDYQWTFAIFNKLGLCINPQVNLVTNIGFGSGAVNTTNSNHPLAHLPLNIAEAITHPSAVEVSAEADKFLLNHVFGVNFRNQYLRPWFYKLIGLWMMIFNHNKYVQMRGSL